MPTLMTLVQHKRVSYLQKKIPSLKEEDPLANVMQMVRRANTASMGKLYVSMNPRLEIHSVFKNSNEFLLPDSGFRHIG